MRIGQVQLNRAGVVGSHGEPFRRPIVTCGTAGPIKHAGCPACKSLRLVWTRVATSQAPIFAGLPANSQPHRAHSFKGRRRCWPRALNFTTGNHLQLLCPTPCRWPWRPGPSRVAARRPARAVWLPSMPPRAALRAVPGRGLHPVQQHIPLPGLAPQPLRGGPCAVHLCGVRQWLQKQ